jgi:hypothetical protein
MAIDLNQLFITGTVVPNSIKSQLFGNFGFISFGLLTAQGTFYPSININPKQEFLKDKLARCQGVSLFHGEFRSDPKKDSEKNIIPDEYWWKIGSSAAKLKIFDFPIEPDNRSFCTGIVTKQQGSWGVLSMGYKDIKNNLEKQRHAIINLGDFGGFDFVDKSVIVTGHALPSAGTVKKVHINVQNINVT